MLALATILFCEDIPLSARILSIVDVYDALVNSRIYKPALPHTEAVQIIMNGSGTQFDPGISNAFREINQSFYTLSQELENDSSLA